MCRKEAKNIGYVAILCPVARSLEGVAQYRGQEARGPTRRADHGNQLTMLEALVRLVRVVHMTIGISEPRAGEEKVIAVAWVILALLLLAVFVVGLFVIG